MSDIEKSDVQIYVEDTLQELLAAAKHGISTLIADVKRPIADDVADERRKSALESKKKAFMDAQEMLAALVTLENKIKLNKNQEYVSDIFSFGLILIKAMFK